MSAETTPITAARFAKALSDLSLSSLYLKVAELRNSIAHLEKSNAELEEYVRQEEDKDCYEAMLENREVIARMEERIELVRKEVTEIRCLPWQPEEGSKMSEVGETPSISGTAGDGSAPSRTMDTAASTQEQQQQRQNGAPADQEEEGVFL